MSDACTDCGRMTVVRVASKDSMGTVHRRCRHCHRGVKGDAACMPLAKRCNFCALVVDSKTAPYVKTRDAYYCNEGCRKEEQCKQREQRKQARSAPSAAKRVESPFASDASGASSTRETISPTKSSSNEMRKFQARKSGTGLTCTPSDGAGATQSSMSSKNSPETSKTASFDRDGIASALRGTGVDLPEWPESCDEVETEPGRWLIGRTVSRGSRQEAGPRVVAMEHGRWRVQKAAEVKGSQEYDPVGAWNRT